MKRDTLANTCHAVPSNTLSNIQEEIPHLEHDVEQAYFTSNRISDTLDSITQRLRYGNSEHVLAQESTRVTGMLNQATTGLQQLNDIESKLEHLKHILFGSN